MKAILTLLFLLWSVRLLNAGNLILSIWPQPGMHIVAVTVFLGLLSVIIILCFRLLLQKQKQVERDHAIALETEELNKKYRLVLHANHTAVWKWNILTKEIDCECDHCLEEDSNQCKHYKVTEDSFYLRIHPDDVERVRNTYKRLMDGEIRMFHEEFRYKLIHAPAEYNWIESFANVGECDQEGHALTVVGGMVVITERKRIEQEAMEKQQAEESNRMKSAFLSNIRHEIRTPLNAIVGFSNLIVQGCDPEEAAEYSRIVQQSNTLLLQLIDDVLDLSDIESGQIDLVNLQVDVSEILLMLEKTYRLKINKGVVLSCDLPARSYFVNIDGGKLTQVLKNLLSNACKFTFSGYIHMGFTLVKNGLYFYITDTGIGIAKENIPHVFDRFAKFDSFTQGVGLGLSISQTIVHKMNGEMGVFSEAGRGSTFWFTVPCEVQICDEMDELNELNELNDKKLVNSEILLAFHER